MLEKIQHRVQTLEDKAKIETDKIEKDIRNTKI